MFRWTKCKPLQNYLRRQPVIMKLSVSTLKPRPDTSSERGPESVILTVAGTKLRIMHTQEDHRYPPKGSLIRITWVGHLSNISTSKIYLHNVGGLPIQDRSKVHLSADDRKRRTHEHPHLSDGQYTACTTHCRFAPRRPSEAGFAQSFH
jgi:hypothetical protein